MEKANFGQIVSFLFGIANDCLVDTYDVGDYRKIILPMMVIRRFDAVLEPTKEKVLKMKEQLDAAGITDQDEALCSVAGEAFCNSSPYTLSDLKSRTNQQQLKSDFILYLNGFSQNVQDIIKRFEFRNQIDKLSEHDILGLLISKFTDSSVNLSNRPIYDAKGNLVQPALDNHTMGTVFEEVIRKFNEETNITDAGRHFTPRDIVELITDLAFVPVKGKIQSTTYRIYDGACGTGGMLTVAEGRMQEMAKEFGKNVSIHLYGQENSDETYAIARSDMLVKGEGVQANNIFFGSSNIKCEDFLRQNPAQVQLKGATVGMMNPPYSQGTKSDPSQYELSFVEHLLDSLTEGARAAVIVPQSSMTGKTKDEQTFKENILKHHTLEGVITCNTDTFYGVGTNPVIAIFTAHEPHPEDKVCKFIDFRDDGYEVRAHIGLVEGDSAKDKRQHLLDVWFGRTEAASKFCVESTVKAEDEWLHSFFYFNDEIPADADFEKAIGDYLTFEFSMIMQNREYLFGQGGEENAEP